ncbi:XRE family transcriptional regulator [Paenibacillus sp. IHBB 10380]|nr:XRE family transcriptional regulator [Paenibacillus sp. IHBB 10380]
MTREWLVKLRTKAEKTHDDIAIEVDISRQYYGMIESGIRNPSVSLAQRIAIVLGFNWINFFTDQGNEMIRCEESTTTERKEVI